MTAPTFTQEKDRAIEAACAAGAIIRSFYSTPYTIDYKDQRKDNPVTIADRDANQKIHDILHAAFPQYGWLSEETVDSPERLSRQRVWLVDPLDGTKEFIDKVPEFGVSIALTENGQPVVGVVYNPIHDQLFWAVRGQGTWCQEQRLRVTATDRLSTATILVSRSETKRGDWKNFASQFTTRPTGSAAYKLALLASGDADATFTLTPKNEWDICAGALLVEEAGGQVSHLDGRPVIFNQPKTLLQGLIASNRQLHSQLLRLVAKR
jgi:myo-inositol-1(or 4)-monophosphatase